MSTTEKAGIPALEMTDVSVDFAVDDVWVPAAKHLTYSIARGQVVAVVIAVATGRAARRKARGRARPPSRGPRSVRRSAGPRSG